jgi:hypothetical protein
MADFDSELTELQCLILDGMADDYENIEPLYLNANRDWDEEERLGAELPLKVGHDRHALHTLIDEVAAMLQNGHIEAKYSNDENIDRLKPLDLTLLHHYWFGSTAKGLRAWEAHRQAASGA